MSEVITINHAERIASLETKVDTISEAVGEVNIKLDKIYDAFIVSKTHRGLAATAGRWVVAGILTLATALHWDTVSTFFKTLPSNNP